MSAALDTSNDFELDLDASRAARREKKAVPAIKIGGRRLELPVELPVDVFAPLTELDMDVSVMIRLALDARNEAQDNDEAVGMAVADSLINMLVANPSLPKDLVAAVHTMGRRFFGEGGYDHLISCRLTVPDIGEIARYAIRQYGVGLGELSQSSDSSEGTGTTSKPTSRGGTRASTSGGSGRSRARKAS